MQPTASNGVEHPVNGYPLFITEVFPQERESQVVPIALAQPPIPPDLSENLRNYLAIML